MMKDVLFVYQLIQKCWNFLYESCGQSNQGLGVEFTNTDNIKVVCSWCRSLDRDGILFDVKFEGGLPISILRKRATHLRKKKGVQNRYVYRLYIPFRSGGTVTGQKIPLNDESLFMVQYKASILNKV